MARKIIISIWQSVVPSGMMDFDVFIRIDEVRIYLYTNATRYTAVIFFRLIDEFYTFYRS